MNILKPFLVKFKYLGLVIIPLYILAQTVSCSGDDSTDQAAPDKDIKLTGQLQPGDSSNPPEEWSKVSGSLGTKVAKSAVPKEDLSMYELYCVTFEEPPEAGYGTADSSGNFTLNLQDTQNVAFGCFVRQNDLTIATMVFEDTNEQGLDGGNIRQGSISLMGSADLGLVILDLERGVALVNMDNITTISDEGEGGAWDFTGTILMTRYDPVPEGYDNFPDCLGPDATEGGDGPCSGMSVYLHRLVGKSFTPDAACEEVIDQDGVGDGDVNVTGCNGTTSSENDFFGIMVWMNNTAMESCGNTLGFSDLEARAFGGIAIDSAASGGLGFGYPDWNIDGSGQQLMEEVDPSWPYGDGWAINGATAVEDVWDCKETENDHQCQGMDPLIWVGDLCSTIPTSSYDTENFDNTILLKLRCFARYFERSSLRGDPSYCLQEGRFEWNTSEPSSFARHGGDVRPGHQFVLEPFTYTGPNSGTFNQTNEWDDGVEYEDPITTENRWTRCWVGESFTMSVTKTSDTTSIGDLQMSKYLVDNDPICEENINQLEIGTVRVMIKMTYQ
jgi:hypothetical protein